VIAQTYSELEARLFSSREIEGVALRYGFFYALTAEPGVYNLVDDDPTLPALKRI
jgi:hypothetical protein